MEDFLNTGNIRIVQPRTREGDIAALGLNIRGPAAEALVSGPAAYERHRSRVEAAKAAAIAAVIRARGLVQPVPADLRQDVVVAAAALCAVEAHVSVGTRGGYPTAGGSTERQRWAYMAGAGTKHSRTGPIWDAAFDEAAQELFRETVGFVLPSEVPGELAPLPVVDPEFALGAGALEERSDYVPDQLYFNRVPVPLEPHWVCALADRALRLEQAGKAAELAAYRALRQAKEKSTRPNWVDSSTSERWQRAWVAAYNVAYERWRRENE